MNMNQQVSPDNQYSTLYGAVEALKEQGYTDELTLTEDGLFNNASPLDPKLFRIDSFHRFEGPSDPADQSIVYAVSCEKLGLKGMLVGDYGANAQDFIHQMVRDLPAQAHEGLVQPVKAVTPGSSMKT